MFRRGAILKWLTGVICTQNYDGFVHNYALYLHGETSRFHIIPWDYDATWGIDVNGEKIRHDYVRVEGFNTLTARLLDAQKYKKLYQQLLYDTIQHQFTVKNLIDAVYGYYEQVKKFISKDPYFQYTLDEFNQQPSQILDFISKRNQFIASHLMF
ncbi:CotH kinase family protein [Aeribacillus sp. FSL K6-1121]|uniref:CotH kinase family protein n=1 Tax=Aeribacillus sp. FSL K6-1121 TaxID=2954745 RepID=UPI002E1CEBD7